MTMKCMMREAPGFSADGLLLTGLKAISTDDASFRTLARRHVHCGAKPVIPKALNCRSNASDVEFPREAPGVFVPRDLGSRVIRSVTVIDESGLDSTSRLRGVAAVGLSCGDRLGLD